jgi:hypothetical protein
MFATTISGGQYIATAPDTCNTIVGPATVPVPYPVVAQTSTANPVSSKVYICGSPALTKASKAKPVSGDQPGATGGGGIISATVMGEVEYISSSGKVKIEGNFAVRQTDSVKMNDGNTVGLDISVCQTKVMIMS